MRAAILSEARPRLEVVDVDDPTPGEGEVVLRISGCGICGSDLHVASAVAPAGAVLGHEFAGVIDEIGPGVEGWATGDVVTARPFFGCGACAWCRRGRQDHCDAFRLVGLHAPGGFAERTVVAAGELHRLPSAVPPVEHALVEPLAVARRVLRRGGLVAGEDVTVLGAGPIGLATVAWARTLGAARVTVSDPVARRREIALALGADAAVAPDEIDAATGPGVALVIESSGMPGVIDQATRLVAVDGRVGVVGVCLKNDTIFPYWALSKEIDVRFSMYYDTADFLDTLDALAGRRLDVAGLVTETISLEELPDRFAALLVEPDAGKVVVTP